MAKKAKEAELPEIEAVEIAEEEKVIEEVKPVDRQAFVARKLRAINDMPNPAKARRLAARVLSN